MPDLGLIEGCDFYFLDAVDAECVSACKFDP